MVAVPQPIQRAEEGAGRGAGASTRRKSGRGRSRASQMPLSGLWAGGGGGRGPSILGLEACPTPNTVECHLSRLTDEHYGSPSNQLNLGHLDTMAGASGGCGEAEGPELRHLPCTQHLFIGGAVGGFPGRLGCVSLSRRFSALSFLRARKRQRGAQGRRFWNWSLTL